MISVCLASYNGEQFIAEQIESILAQLSTGDELIISDDGSNDQTIGITSSFNDSRIKIINNDKCKGVIKNFENALMHAKGDYIFLSDQDDVWLPSKVKESIKYLDKNLLVVSDCRVVDKQLKEISHSFFRLRGSKKGILNNIVKNSYLGCCMAFRKELLQYALPIPNGAAMHDIWLGLVAETQGTVQFIDKQLILFRRHGANASFTTGKSQLSTYIKLKNRITVAGLLLLRILRNYFR